MLGSKQLTQLQTFSACGGRDQEKKAKSEIKLKAQFAVVL